MHRRVDRRHLLAGAAAVAVAGCLGVGGDGDTADETGDGLPEDCPTTQGLDVERPENLTTQAVRQFVERYEKRYYREVVLDYEPDSRLDAYRLGGSVRERVERRDDGYVAEFEGGGAVYRPDLQVTAAVAEAPAGRDPLDHEEIDDEDLRGLLEDAVEADRNDEEDGDDDHGDDETVRRRIETGARIDAFLDLLESEFDRFEAFDGPDQSAALYADVDGTTVELSVYAGGLHGDYWWSARYYVDEHVVRRTDDDALDPRKGALLECRETG